LAQYSVDIVAKTLGGGQVDKLAESLRGVDQAANKSQQSLKGIDAAAKGATPGVRGLGTAIAAALGPLVSITAALALFKKATDTAFERGNAEQRLQNLTNSAGEYQAALGIAARSSQTFGLSQTETTKALADVYGRLKGVGFGLKETGEIYDGFNAIAKQSGLGAAEASGAFFQLSQALGKGKLNGDEFVTVSERMPQLLDAIAKTTGKTRGELAQMAQDGKITSQVLYEALAGSAAAAGDLNAKLSAQQRAMNAVSLVSDRLLNTLGKVFAPIVIKGAELLVVAGEKLAEWWDYLGGVVFPQVASAVKPLITEMQKIWTAIPWETLLGYLQGALIKAINNVVGAIKLVVPVLTFVLKKFQELSSNPVFKFIAEQVGRLAGFLGISSTAVQDFANKQKTAATDSAELAKNYSSMPEAAEKVADATKAAAEATKLFKEDVAKIKDSYDLAGQALDRMATKQQLTLSVASAQLGAEQALNNLMGERLQREYDAAKTADERFNIAVRMFNQQVKAAELEYKQALLNNDAAVDAALLQQKKVDLKYQEMRAERDLAAARGQDVSAYDQALGSQKEAVALAKQQMDAADDIRKYSNQTALAILQGKIEAAGLNLQTKLASDAIGIATQRATVMANEYARAAAAAIQMRNAAGGGGAPAAPKSTGFISAGGQTVKLAKGGYVTGPTNALIGEGGESEYVVPESKMGEAMQRYAAGARGAAVIPGSANVNVSYSGSIVSMGGSDYISKGDVPGLLSSAVNQTLKTLQRSPDARRFAGVR